MALSEQLLWQFIKSRQPWNEADVEGKLPTIKIAVKDIAVILAAICSLLERHKPNGLIKEFIDCAVTFKLSNIISSFRNSVSPVCDLLLTQ
ncbi:MAG: hypothetical protein ACH349_00555 [Candidatus Rhabdochlamydia sp.]